VIEAFPLVIPTQRSRLARGDEQKGPAMRGFFCSAELAPLLLTERHDTQPSNLGSTSKKSPAEAGLFIAAVQQFDQNLN